MNSRNLVLFATAVVSTIMVSCGNAQTLQDNTTANTAKNLTYIDWEAQAKTNIRLLPKYGGRSKTQHQKEADDRLIDSFVKQYGSRRKGSEALISTGFEYLHRKDLKTAMYRFNQAWLLDSLNADVFCGYGAVYSSLNEPALAMKQYDEGLRIDPNNPRIIKDKANILSGNIK